MILDQKNPMLRPVGFGFNFSGFGHIDDAFIFWLARFLHFPECAFKRDFPAFLD
jgi:hypothetical protein